MKKDIISFNKTCQQGFSLIEVMVAMLIGLVLMSGVFQVFFSSKESQEIIADQVELVDESRVSLEMLAYDIKRAGLWGKTRSSINLTNNVVAFNVVLAKLAASNDCTNAIGNTQTLGRDTGWALDVFRAIYGVSEEFITANGFPYSDCISGNYLRGDTIEVRYAGERVAFANLDDATVYIISQGQFSDVFYGAVKPTQPAGADALYGTDAIQDPPVTYHKYEAVLYYVSSWTDAVGDGVPSLRRVSLQSGPELVDDVVLTGVENLQVQFGMDMDNDPDTQTVQRYMDPSSIAVTAADSQWAMVRSVQVWAIVRSKQSRPENAAQTFAMPAMTATTSYAPGADGYKRIMVSAATKLRNIEFVEGK